MADAVHYFLEQMLPELEDLEKRGLFSRSEVKEIVKRRRDFEYQLRRRSRLKEDFLRYVEYEKQLESLRVLRKKAMLKELKASGENWHSALSDRTSVQRIMSIFQRAVQRFKGDLNLWLHYLEYCRSRGNRRMQKVLAKALQLHPHVPGLWIYSAAWELENNLNITAARAQMQRGLRMCPHSEELWLEYFRMELAYAHKLKARKKILGIDSESSTEIELSIKLARVIFQNAVAAAPSNPNFRQKFLEIMDRFGITDSGLEEKISAGLVQDFPTNEECWNWKAMRCFKKSGSWKDAAKMYEEAIEKVNTSGIFEVYSEFLENLLKEDSSSSEEIVDALMRVYEVAEKRCLVSSRVLEGHVGLVLRQGWSLQKARDMVIQLCNTPLKTSPNLWVVRLSLELQYGEEDDNSIATTFFHALNLFHISDAKALWYMAMEYLAGKESYFDKLMELLERSLGGKGSGKSAADVACCAVDCVVQSRGIEKARSLYKRFLALPGPSVELVKHCISIEGVRKGGMENMRKVFDVGVEMYGKHDCELWLEYCMQERKVGTSEGANAVYWRARKTLEDPSEFVERHYTLFP